MRFKKLMAISLCLLPLSSMASPDALWSWRADWLQSQAPKVDLQDPMTYERGLKQFQDDVYADQDYEITLTPVEKHQALVWVLTSDEEKRYVLLMQNKSGLWWGDAKLSPVEILGINARNTDERNHFAVLYAEQLQARVAKELAWEVSADSAKRTQNQGIPFVRPFNLKPFSPYNAKPIALQNNDQLFLFTNISLNVKRIMATLLKDLDTDPSIHLNIFFTDQPENTAVDAWAASQNIPEAIVLKGAITLNTNSNLLTQIPGNHDLPILILVRSGAATKVDTSLF